MNPFRRKTAGRGEKRICLSTRKFNGSLDTTYLITFKQSCAAGTLSVWMVP